MTTVRIDSRTYRSLLSGGSVRLEEKRDQINKLNVFPVPDGDTGDNMLLTLQSGLAEMAADGDLPVICDALSRGMLYGARGNSGVILSRFFSGMNDCLSKGGDVVTADTFIAGMEKGVSEAYAAVSSPKEGTILTVMRETADAVKKESPADFETLFERAHAAAAEALKNTPEQLEVLKSAGVVDSGGAGFLCILEGMRSALEGGTTVSVGAVKTTVTELTGDEEMLGYCTEFLLQKMSKEPFELETFKAFLNSVGNSVVAFETGSIVKTHVHTFQPEKVLAEAHRYGEFLTLKIENMTVMHSESTVENEFEIPESKKKYGLVAVACGDGIKQLLENGGCAAVVDGGRSMNPSAQDILQGIRQAGADTVFVFPNHKNAFLAAKQAGEMCDFCDVIVIPSQDIGHCYYALSGFDDSLSPDELTKSFESAGDLSRTVHIAKAIRACTENGVTVQEGDWICFDQDHILLAAPTEDEAAVKLMETLDPAPDVALLLTGEASPDDAAALEERLAALYPDTEFITINGGQPIYSYTFIMR